ncbi:hypothetical protein EU534_01385, partial [Candidatus Heimdallarchaeota archaeon]
MPLLTNYNFCDRLLFNFTESNNNLQTTIAKSIIQKKKLMRKCYLVEYDYLEYRHSLELQENVRSIKEENREFDNFLLVLQHNPVFTIGKKGSRDDILATEEILTNESIDVLEVRRGGEVTYHGPGQLV